MDDQNPKKKKKSKNSKNPHGRKLCIYLALPILKRARQACDEHGVHMSNAITAGLKLWLQEKPLKQSLLARSVAKVSRPVQKPL